METYIPKPPITFCFPNCKNFWVQEVKQQTDFVRTFLNYITSINKSNGHSTMYTIVTLTSPSTFLPLNKHNASNIVFIVSDRVWLIHGFVYIKKVVWTMLSNLQAAKKLLCSCSSVCIIFTLPYTNKYSIYLNC